MNPTVVAALIVAAGTGVDELQQPTLLKPIQINKKVEITFTRPRVEALCEKVILSSDMHIPFEVVGSKKLFARMLNQANLSECEIQEIFSTQVLSDGLKLKLQNIINETHKSAVNTIEAANKQYETEWRKLYYKYNFDLSLIPWWRMALREPREPKFVFTKVHDYVKHLDLEKVFDSDDLNSHYQY